MLLFAAPARDLAVVSSDLRPAGRQSRHSRPASVLYKGVSRCCALFFYAQHMKCIHVPAARPVRPRDPELPRLSSLSVHQSICNHFMTWISIFLNLDDYVWSHGSHFLIHEELADAEGQCCIILLPEFCFCFGFFFLLLQYSYCGKTVLFCSVLVSNVQCKVSVLMTKHNLLPQCRALQWRQIHRAR